MNNVQHIISKLIDEAVESVSFKFNINKSKIISELTRRFTQTKFNNEGEVWQFSLFCYYYILTYVVVHMTDLPDYPIGDRNNFHWNDHHNAPYAVHRCYDSLCKTIDIIPEKFSMY